MIVTHASAINFQSYDTIEFSYNTLGLALVSGPTGAGKSTLLDLIPWVLYGVTSKEGAADDVRSWDADEPTTAWVKVTLPGLELAIHRARGKGPQNDLYWLENGSWDPIRGKDITETQKLLEARLGVSSDLFLIGSYMTQFSKADSFFIAKAKDRREVLEKIADQEFAITLGEKTSNARKEAKKEASALESTLASTQGKLSALKDSIDGLKQSQKNWDTKQNDKIRFLSQKSTNFEQEHEERLKSLNNRANKWELEQSNKRKAARDRLGNVPKGKPLAAYDALIEEATVKISSLKQTPCPTCGGFESSALQDLRAEVSSLKEQRQAERHNTQVAAEAMAQLEALMGEKNPHLEAFNQAHTQSNPYIEQLDAALAEINPFYERMDATWAAIEMGESKAKEESAALTTLETRVSQLTWLYDKSFELRGLLMSRAVNRIQSDTNGYLEKYFDAALRINLTIEGSDKIEVEIYNEGHLSPFRSLSGGERCILKLCFSLSLMKSAQDKAGVSFGTIMLDEPLNGLDDDLKAKAFGLLQEISNDYPTVLVIEHSESIKNLFDTKFVVAKSGGRSTIVLSE